MTELICSWTAEEVFCTIRISEMKENFLIENKPTVTMMIQARTPERILELIKKGNDGGTDRFGLQLEKLEQKYVNPDTLSMLFEAMGKPCYLTNYRTNPYMEKTDEQLAEEMLMAIKAGGALADVMGDIFCRTQYELTKDETAVQKQKEYIEKIHALGGEVLMSSHTCKYFEPETVLEYSLCHKERGADISKIVTAADSEQELLENYRTEILLRQKIGIPTLFLCVGSFCHDHRRIAPLFGRGMFLCVAEYDDLATPAQPLLSQAREIISAVYGN